MNGLSVRKWRLMTMSSETYAGPMPPEVSEKSVTYAKRELRELADHYSWSDQELAEDMREIAEYIEAVSRTDTGDK